MRILTVGWLRQSVFLHIMQWRLTIESLWQQCILQVIRFSKRDGTKKIILGSHGKPFLKNWSSNLIPDGPSTSTCYSFISGNQVMFMIIVMNSFGDLVAPIGDQMHNSWVCLLGDFTMSYKMMC